MVAVGLFWESGEKINVLLPGCRPLMGHSTCNTPLSPPFIYSPFPSPLHSKCGCVVAPLWGAIPSPTKYPSNHQPTSQQGTGSSQQYNYPGTHQNRHLVGATNPYCGYHHDINQHSQTCPRSNILEAQISPNISKFQKNNHHGRRGCP